MDMDSWTNCPFCDLSFPTSQIDWHANTHFEDPHHLPSQFDPSPPQSLPREQEASGSQFGETSGDGNYWCGGGTTTSKDNGECTIDDKISHLLVRRPEAREALFGGSGFVPDIPSLQRWLEIAWEKGFDAPGSAQLDHVVYGSKKWIGTTECAALLRSFGLRARVVDFGPKESLDDTMDKLHSNKMVNSNEKIGKAYQVLMDFVWNYFSDESSVQFGHHRVVISEKTPLYFQHYGHSRTIVGIQIQHQQNGILQYNLLVLDPSHNTAALERSLRKQVGWQKLIKRGMHTLKKPQYQLCYVDPGIASDEETEKLKTIDSVFLEL